MGTEGRPDGNPPKHVGERPRRVPARKRVPGFRDFARISAGLRVAMAAATATAICYLVYEADSDMSRPADEPIVTTLSKTARAHDLVTEDAQPPEAVKDVTP